MEYIIIDGGSTDGTLDIIRKYDNDIDYWVSEKDDGIYDAMNKGIDLVTGDWINFMNAGDCFSHNDVLSRVFKGQRLRDATVIYGDHFVKYEDFAVKRTAGVVDEMWKGSQFCHQSAFIEACYHKNNKYNVHNKITADFEFFYNAFFDGKAFKGLQEAICIFSAGGVSDVNRIKSIVSWLKVVCQRTCTFKVVAYYFSLIGVNWMKVIAKKVLPQHVVRILRK
jgi:glycosyltransferase involved in cell wall biosynthesis